MAWFDDLLRNNWLPASQQQSPLLNALARNPVGAETLHEQSLTNPTPGVQPGVEWGGQMVSKGLYDKAQLGAGIALGMAGEASWKLVPEGRAGRFHIYSPEGKRTGNASLYYDHDTKTVDVDWIGAGKGDANTLGPKALLQLRQQVMALYPDAERIGGMRVSGSRSDTQDISIPLRKSN